MSQFEFYNVNKLVILIIDLSFDRLTDLALEYDIQSVPVLMIIRDGKVHKKIVGLQGIIHKYLVN